jgi:hypothetical protein
MAQDGRAGPALGIAAFGSYIAGTLSILGLMFLAPLLARGALAFGPPEYFSLMCLGLTILIYLASGSMIKALMMAALGLIIGCIGADMLTNVHRFTLGIPELMDGVGLIPLVMGLFGISEVLLNIEIQVKQEILKGKIKNLLPNLQEWKDSAKPILRGSLLGFSLGILPGAGPAIASFVSYAVEKRVSRHPEKFGQGAIEGVAGPESANNAATGGSFIPLFSLGIPSNSVMHSTRRPDDSRRCSRAQPGAAKPGPLLGGRGQHVSGKHHAAGPEPSPHRALGKVAQGPLCHSLSSYSSLLPDRSLHREQQNRRPLPHDFLRAYGVPSAEISVRSGPAHPGFCSWSHAGRCLEAIFDHFRRKPEDFLPPPDFGDDPGSHHSVAPFPSAA